MELEPSPTLSPELNPWFAVFWVVWILGFVVAEGLALKRRAKGDTLTEHWRWVRSKAGIAFGVATAVGLIWLFAHFIFGV